MKRTRRRVIGGEGRERDRVEERKRGKSDRAILLQLAIAKLRQDGGLFLGAQVLGLPDENSEKPNSSVLV